MEIIAKEILSTIYKEIYTRDVDFSINVFLCGKITSSDISIRNKVYNAIKKHEKFNVVFPEWLFSSLLQKKEYNLLDLERILAGDVDVIILPLEGFGTFAELGCFVSFKEISKKIILINDKKYRNKKSFVNIGPVKLIKQNDKNNLYYYKTEFDEEDAKKIIKKLIYRPPHSYKSDLKNIFNLSRFIFYTIGIFQPVSKSDLENYLNEFKKGIPKHFIEPCLEILIRKTKIQMDIDNGNEVYKLSEEGHHNMYEILLKKLGISDNFAFIRAKILNAKFRKNNKLNLLEEGRKYLDFNKHTQ